MQSLDRVYRQILGRVYKQSLGICQVESRYIESRQSLVETRQSVRRVQGECRSSQTLLINTTKTIPRLYLDYTQTIPRLYLEFTNRLYQILDSICQVESRQSLVRVQVETRQSIGGVCRVQVKSRQSLYVDSRVQVLSRYSLGRVYKYSLGRSLQS